MKKLNYLLFGFILLFPSQSFVSQALQITYELKYQPKIEDTLTIKEKFLQGIDFSEKKSNFSSLDLGDSAFNAVVFKDFNNNKFQKMETISTNLFSLNYKFPTTWKLLKEQKQVLSYPCSKAVITFGGRDWEAWYTNQISFPDGPYKFHGLPGLILEVKSSDGEYHFKATNIEKIGKIKSISNRYATDFNSKENEIKYKKKLFLDPTIPYNTSNSEIFGIAVFNGVEITKRDSDKYRVERFRKFVSAHNNPIEKGDIWVN